MYGIHLQAAMCPCLLIDLETEKMTDRPRNLPGVEEIMSYMSFSESVTSDDLPPRVGFPEDSLGADSDAPSDGTTRSYGYFIESGGGGNIFQSLQVAYGGVVDGGTFTIDELPNTFLDPSQNVFSTVEFSVVDHEQIILLVRVLGNDGRLYPRLVDDVDDPVQLVLRAEYDNGADTYVSNPLPPGPSTGNANFIQTEEVPLTEGGFEENTFKPFIFVVPLRSIITFITIDSATYGRSLSLRVRRSPGQLDEFGFLAINRTNNSFDMIESRLGRSFGLVFDQVGSWDILITPEAVCRQTQVRSEANFSYGQRMYMREPEDVDENFIMGIGRPTINRDNDIVSFDTSSLPQAVRNGISIFPVSGYPKAWVMRIQPSVREYLMGLRRTAVGSSLQGCYVDIPVYARGTRSLAEGTANVRLFAEVGCVFDYTFCDFYWNLGAPLPNVPPAVVQNLMELAFEELVECGTDATVNEDGLVTATSFFLVTIRNMPALDTGNAMLLLKTTETVPYLVRVYRPSAPVVSRLKRMPVGQSDPPWEFVCPSITASEVINLNRIKMYVGGSLASPITNPTEIAERSVVEDSLLVIQPRFNFPPADEIAPDAPQERVVASLGMTFKNWRNADNLLFSETMLLAAEFQYPTDAEVDLSLPLRAKLYYNEDRRII
jgi:hypothetical protein